MSIRGGPTIVNQGLVLHLDAGNIKSYQATGSTWYDVSGTDSIFSNGPYTFPTFNTNGYFSFVNDGVTRNNIVSTAQPSLATVTQYTRTAWFLLTGNNTGWSPIISNVIGNNTDMSLGVHNNLLRFHQYTNTQNEGTTSGDYRLISGSLPVNLNQWYMGAIVVDLVGKTITFYLNGVFDAVRTIVTIGNSSSNQIVIGGAYADGYSGNRMFKGNIAMCSHYNRLLSADEILQNFNATRSRFNV